MFKKGIKFSEEHKIALRKARKGKKPALGKQWSVSEEVKEKHRKISTGSGNGMWKGGKIKTSQGYVRVIKKDHPFSDKSGYVREHRLVMEGKIDRYLKPNEVIHHIDGNKSNNKINNLMLFPNHSEHRRFEGAIK